MEGQKMLNKKLTKNWTRRGKNITGAVQLLTEWLYDIIIKIAILIRNWGRKNEKRTNFNQYMFYWPNGF